MRSVTAIGGATLAAEAAASGLIDEVYLRTACRVSSDRSRRMAELVWDRYGAGSGRLERHARTCLPTAHLRGTGRWPMPVDC
jgi:riboflavin biosynthesis pyrimidine reductase